MVPEAYQKTLKENQFDIVSEPSIHDVMYSEGSPFLFKVTIETRPNIELKDYKNLELKAVKRKGKKPLPDLKKSAQLKTFLKDAFMFMHHITILLLP